MIAMIAAMTTGRVIGRDGGMPWHLPADMAWFRQHTLGKPVIMGRKTWESIGEKALPGRRNIVVSSDESLQPEGADLAGSPEQAVQIAGSAEEIMIIGGSNIYSQFLPQADRLYITLINADISGDSLFPDYQQFNWQPVSSVEREADEKNAYACTFMILDRIP